MNTGDFDCPHRGFFLPQFRQAPEKPTPLSSLVDEVLDLMLEDDTHPDYELHLARGLGSLYYTLDTHGTRWQNLSTDPLMSCWNAWLNLPIPDKAAPWMACTVNLLTAYGADIEEPVSDPTGSPSTLKKLFSQDDTLSEYMVLDRTAFMKDLLQSATPPAHAKSWRRSL